MTNDYDNDDELESINKASGLKLKTQVREH